MTEHDNKAYCKLKSCYLKIKQRCIAHKPMREKKKHKTDSINTKERRRSEEKNQRMQRAHRKHPSG